MESPAHAHPRGLEPRRTYLLESQILSGASPRELLAEPAQAQGPQQGQAHSAGGQTRRGGEMLQHLARRALAHALSARDMALQHLRGEPSSLSTSSS